MTRTIMTATLDEPPPLYSSQTGLATTSIPSPPTFKTKPTNFLTISTGDTTTRGEYVIDSSICLPSSLLPPLDKYETEYDRKNLCVSSKFSVNADIWLLGLSSGEIATTGSEKRYHTTIALSSDYGSINAQVHTLDGAAPFILTAHAYQWSSCIYLPRTFKGLLLLSTRFGSITFSDPLLPNITQLSPLDTTRQYFVGDIRELGYKEWKGSRVEIEARYGIRVRYVDEVAESQGKKGLLSRLFGK